MVVDLPARSFDNDLAGGIPPVAGRHWRDSSAGHSVLYDCIISTDNARSETGEYTTKNLLQSLQNLRKDTLPLPDSNF